VRRAGALLVVVLAWSCGGPKDAPAPPAAAGNRLSVLLLTIDTLRADHLGAYGYTRPTSPRIDALARSGALFEQAYTYWPKTRGSFVALMTGKRASQTGYGKTHPELLGMNPTLASVLKAAGYRTQATVDNPNVARALGYAQGFDAYRETWEEKALVTEMDRTRTITEDGVRFLKEARPGAPFLLWLHYVNPHAPYTPPPPFDSAFRDEASKGGSRVQPVSGFHGGVPKQWFVSGEDRLGYYVAQYDGEIATVDQEIGKVVDALAASAVAGETLVVLTSDHGESLGEHDYFFDHGENLFDPSLVIPLVFAGPGVKPGHRTAVFATTLDLLPTILDALKVSYPPNLAGESLWPAVRGGDRPDRARLYAQNDRNFIGTWDRRYKIVGVPEGDAMAFTLVDREKDPGETRNVAAAQPDALRAARRELDALVERVDREWASTRGLLQGQPTQAKLSADACEKLRALGYLPAGCP
jgi:arylsulfatase A-like enzyme